LFHATIRENIAYAHHEATSEADHSSRRSAAIHDFIAALPDGYDTLVGERGLTLFRRPAPADRDSRAPCSAVRRSWFSMSRPPPWTPLRKGAFPIASPG